MAAAADRLDNVGPAVVRQAARGTDLATLRSSLEDTEQLLIYKEDARSVKADDVQHFCKLCLVTARKAVLARDFTLAMEALLRVEDITDIDGNRHARRFFPSSGPRLKMREELFQLLSQVERQRGYFYVDGRIRRAVQRAVVPSDWMEGAEVRSDESDDVVSTSAVDMLSNSTRGAPNMSGLSESSIDAWRQAPHGASRNKSWAQLRHELSQSQQTRGKGGYSMYPAALRPVPPAADGNARNEVNKAKKSGASIRAGASSSAFHRLRDARRPTIYGADHVDPRRLHHYNVDDLPPLDAKQVSSSGCSTVSISNEDYYSVRSPLSVTGKLGTRKRIGKKKGRKNKNGANKRGRWVGKPAYVHGIMVVERAGESRLSRKRILRGPSHSRLRTEAVEAVAEEANNNTVARFLAALPQDTDDLAPLPSEEQQQSAATAAASGAGGMAAVALRAAARGKSLSVSVSLPTVEQPSEASPSQQAGGAAGAGGAVEPFSRSPADEHFPQLLGFGHMADDFEPDEPIVNRSKVMEKDRPPETLPWRVLNVHLSHWRRISRKRRTAARRMAKARRLNRLAAKGIYTTKAELAIERFRQQRKTTDIEVAVKKKKIRATEKEKKKLRAQIRREYEAKAALRKRVLAQMEEALRLQRLRKRRETEVTRKRQELAMMKALEGAPIAIQHQPRQPTVPLNPATLRRKSQAGIALDGPGSADGPPMRKHVDMKQMIAHHLKRREEERKRREEEEEQKRREAELEQQRKEMNEASSTVGRWVKRILAYRKRLAELAERRRVRKKAALFIQCHLEGLRARRAVMYVKQVRWASVCVTSVGRMFLAKLRVREMQAAVVVEVEEQMHKDYRICRLLSRFCRVITGRRRVRVRRDALAEMHDERVAAENADTEADVQLMIASYFLVQQKIQTLPTSSATALKESKQTNYAHLDFIDEQEYEYQRNVIFTQDVEGERRGYTVATEVVVRCDLLQEAWARLHIELEYKQAYQRIYAQFASRRCDIAAFEHDAAALIRDMATMRSVVQMTLPRPPTEREIMRRCYQTPSHLLPAK